MLLDPNSTKNVFQLFAEVKKIPFAMSRHHWSDQDFVVVTNVAPKGKYGVAHGFPVHDGKPNDHLAYAACWTSKMELPNAGSYQWRIISIPDERLTELISEFYREVAPSFGFSPPKHA
jgi:hypothetical protein